MKDSKGVTELDGAILAEIGRHAPCTAYRMRQGFQASRSTEWSASTGAVYPALRRLRRAGLVDAAPAADRRGGEAMSLSAAGRRALAAWLADAERASSPGLDPFRTRAGYWAALGADERAALAPELEAGVLARIAALEAAGEPEDAVERTWRAYELALQAARLAWLSSATG